MKIIHCGDIHLDSKIESNLPTAKSRERKKEIVMAFCRMVDYAVENGVTAVIIAGDLFDTDRMLPTTRDVVLGKIASAKGTDFLYLCGNHDAGKALLQAELPENLKLFKDSWVGFRYQNVCITGVELTEENCRHIYGGLSLEPQCFNIVTMHGELSTSYGKESVNRNELADKPIRYLALGHIHKYQSGTLGKNGIWCHCGCLEGRGFDECGDKGFVVIDIDDNGSFTYEFIKSSQRDIVELDCDISGLFDASEMVAAIDRTTESVPHNAMVKVVLKGNIPADARKDIEYFKKHLGERFWFAKVKDDTRIELRAEDYINDVSLKGEFIRTVLEAGLSQEVADSVIACGLAALSGQEVL